MSPRAPQVGWQRCTDLAIHLTGAVISASWDSTVRITPLSTPGTSLVLPVADKVYSLALSKSKLVVAMGGRQVWIYDIAALKEALEKGTEGKDVAVWQKRESSLKFMTRAVKAMPTDQGTYRLVCALAVRLANTRSSCRLCHDLNRRSRGSRVL